MSFLSGLRLATDNPMQWVWLSELSIVPQGDMFVVHQWAAYGWLILALIAMYYFIRSIRLKNKPGNGNSTGLPPKRKNLFIQVMYWLIPLQLVSGLLLYLSVLPSLNALLIGFHYLSALVLTALVVYHSFEQLLIKRCRYLWQVLLPRNSSIIGVASLCLVITVSVAGFFAWDKDAVRSLNIKRISPDINVDIDGEFSEAFWQGVDSVSVVTAQGNDYTQSVPVEVKAVHNGFEVYMAIRWPDATEDYEHLPMVKTEQGWKVLQEGFERDDERRYFEDKMAIMLSETSEVGGAGSTHLGRKPLKNKPASRSGRGFHYTTDGSVRDVWHWKALRVNTMSVLDDDHFGEPSPDCAHCPRYTAGYHPDPQETGAVRHNWQWFKPAGVIPIRLPEYPEDIQKITQKTFTDDAIRWRRTTVYSPEQDNYPVGTKMPSVLIGEILNGDRGDVRAKGKWKDGYWYLEIARSLQTPSAYDLPVKDGIYIWFAPFDHAQTRHSYHFRPLKIRVENNGKAEVSND
ncbi:ethylbenzene dehydrogenase-related protein [Teredinibacter sp. KSP-S5-2]|uniref:ethylbenzene dehydrogenase-related protein n=1 Tax=Teredinibacter sp. KSP-S5-2 TaxID=3034506 RepID=UPI0029343EB4|nr:ethylbenzene dehydrogenase-related protein [Teredinibacter sp. KSP-S5-2]WNO10011.1 ethylbenzene dehydrogenase-related protein [Teredinibacter sp. KSP-S5-2]